MPGAAAALTVGCASSQWAVTTTNACATYRVATSLPRFNRTPNPFCPMVAAMAPKTPNGANNIT